ncbi:inositol 1,4,5-trisphosphate receptor-interacting protein-like 1 [Accipiter gentilis]|uniref:inositol 1,4,5-trisphosphate receptor-interacting protein-like 1 n=1 Tax=Astur gentilis TaxID=8957 RepID=UPI0021101C83|nr:inositol 1,4,5-trisphosphate receptor-interacting protein-like 1 [Accipiter gentilis]
MDVALFFAKLVRIILQNAQLVGEELDEVTREHMRQREVYLSWEMTQMLQELEQGMQEQSSFAWGTLLFAALQWWQFWAVAGGLLLLFGLCWQLWKRSCEPGSSSKHGSSRSLEEEEDEEEGEEPLHMDRFRNKYLLWPLPNRVRICTVVEELVNDLLCVCRTLSGNDFMPRLQPAVGLGGFQEGQSAHEEDFIYCLIVPLKPPPGHSFHLELGTEGEMLARNCCVRVELECMCTRERWLGDVICFLHHPEDKLMSCQEASLLETLCTGSYLDVEKTAFWLQELMTAASVDVPRAATSKVTVLPSTRFCRLKLTNTCEIPLSIELILAVQQGNSDTFVSME